MTAPDHPGRVDHEDLPQRGARGVVLGGAALVLAVWVALVLSSRGGNTGAGPPDPGVSLPAALAGFRADLWYLPDDAALGFMEIPGGPFTMGSDPRVDPMAFEVERWSPDDFQGTVDIADFRIGRTEVTVAQYAAFVRTSGHPVVDARALEGAPDHPVVYVAWTDAVAYTQWLDGALRERQEALPPVLAGLVAEGWRVALPNEAQWEKAARGEDARVWPWGHEPRPDRANFGSPGVAPVGSYPCPECPYPVADMAGNVWEWTRTPYRPYPWVDDAPALDSEAAWVVRGGSFGDPAQQVRSANRGARVPGARLPFIGFRVALVRE